MPIDRCYCRDVTFADLKALAAREGADVDHLSERTGVGTGCGLCLPYLRVVLATGKTELPVLSGADVERICAGAEKERAAAQGEGAG